MLPRAVEGLVAFSNASLAAKLLELTVESSVLISCYLASFGAVI